MSRFYIVEQIANRTNSQEEGYAQGLEVFLDDRFVGGWYESGFDIKYCIVQSKRFEAIDAIDALVQFENYLHNRKG